jgi:uncharacterized protein (TIGR00730 family)
MNIHRICVFCGSRSGSKPIYADGARRLGKAIAARGLELVYGAGHVGLMGVLADAALAAGGRVVGVIPRSLVVRELAHRGLSEMIVVDTMHERKARMADRAEAFLALPGGYGTLDELFEILTWAQLGIHGKPIGLINTDGYFDSLLAWIDRSVSEEFVRPAYRALLRVGREPEETLAAVVDAGPPPTVPSWGAAADR